MKLLRPPAGWPLERIEALADLVAAGDILFTLDAMITAVGGAGLVIDARRTELKNHIRDVLAPRFRDAP